MKKIKFILLIVFFLISNIAVSQTLHAIIFADTWSDDIGESVKVDYQNMDVEFALIALANKMELNLLDECIGENFNKQTAEKVLNNLRCGPNDIVFFYYSGHGGRSSSQYPMLALKGGGIALHTVDEIISRKSPRLRIIMADCCNGTTREDIRPQGDLGGASRLNAISEAFYKNLFGSSVRGCIIVSSSGPGENSVSLSVGGAFTFSFLQEIQKMKAAGSNTNWNILLERSKNTTYQLARHTPIFNIDPGGRLISASTPSVPTTTPSTTTPSTSTSTTVESEPRRTPQPPIIRDKTLEEALAMLINNTLNDDYRISLIQPMLNQFFAPNAVVRIYGRNGTLVRRETAANFLNRIAIAHNLSSLRQQDSQKGADGKYTEINFHEIYSSD